MANRGGPNGSSADREGRARLGMNRPANPAAASRSCAGALAASRWTSYVTAAVLGGCGFGIKPTAFGKLKKPGIGMSWAWNPAVPASRSIATASGETGTVQNRPLGAIPGSKSWT